MHSRGGFTLIELLLATLLTSILMVGVLAVITRLAGPLQAPAGADAPLITRSSPCLQVLADDLRLARTVTSTDREIRITGFASLDPETGERSQRPVRLRYYSKSIAGRDWLLREQTELSDSDAQTRVTEAVMAGVSTIELRPPPQLTESASGEHQGDRLLDGLWRLRLWAGQASPDDKPIVDQALVLPRSLAG